MPVEDIEGDFPNLRTTQWEITSPITDIPNCIGWALHDVNQFWDPSMVGVRGYYWPPGIPRVWNRNTLRQVFELHGYSVCDNAELEVGFEKVAIYVDEDDEPTHATIQTELGKWSSKLGVYEDIEHPGVDSLESKAYGTVAIVMKRRRN
jgi:hypothetical protein